MVSLAMILYGKQVLCLKYLGNQTLIIYLPWAYLKRLVNEVSILFGNVQDDWGIALSVRLPEGTGLLGLPAPFPNSVSVIVIVLFLQLSSLQLNS